MDISVKQFNSNTNFGRKVRITKPQVESVLKKLQKKEDVFSTLAFTSAAIAAPLIIGDFAVNKASTGAILGSAIVNGSAMSKVAITKSAYEDLYRKAPLEVEEDELPS